MTAAGSKKEKGKSTEVVDMLSDDEEDVEAEIEEMEMAAAEKAARKKANDRAARLHR